MSLTLATPRQHNSERTFLISHLFLLPHFDFKIQLSNIVGTEIIPGGKDMSSVHEAGSKSSDPKQLGSEKADEGIEPMSLEDECKRRGYLDGTCFSPDLSRSISTKLYADCQLCMKQWNKTKPILGTLKVLSNYKTHLQVCQADCFGYFFH